MFQRLAFLLILVLSLSACNRDVSVSPNGDGTATVTVSVTESEINTIISNALNNAGNPLLRNPEVDLQNGQIVVSGEHDRRDGSGTVSGTITLNATVSNGQLVVTVTSVDIEGWDASDERIAEFNENLAERLGGRARQDNAGATLESVTITNDAFQISILVEIQRGE